MLHIKVYRYAKSLDYRGGAAPTIGNSAWQTNDKNNSLDDFMVYDDSKLIFRCRVQTVSNMEGIDPSYSFTDTIAPGPFILRAFVDPRQHRGRIHGISRTYTLAGDYITSECVTSRNAARWLLHDWQRVKPNTGDTRVAWSAGCFVIPDEALDSLGVLFDGHGVTPGTLINGELVEA